MELWYTQPAADWNAALPAGNGRLGCMQFGGVARERFQLNEDSLWSGGPMHRLNPDASATLPKVQELLRQGRLPDAERWAGLDPVRHACIPAFGRFDFGF